MSRLFVSTRKGLLVYSVANDRISPHSEHFLGDSVSSFVIDHAGHWFAALNLGHFGPKMQMSTDQGNTWTEIACPALPAKPEDSDEKGDWQIKQVWILEAMPGEPGRLIAGTIPGAVFERLGDGTWQLKDDLWYRPERTNWFGGGFDESGVHSIAIDPNDPNCWTVGVSVGGVWHTKDAGQNWTLKCSGMKADYMPEDMVDADDLQDPHRLVQSETKTNRMWVQHHCGIFVSDNSGKDWTECHHNGASSFGFTVVVHPTKENTAWFVPAIKDESRYPKEGKLTVLRTDDGGKTFEEQTNGLPTENAFDLIYRHAMVVDATGEWLAFGSTTGNLWFSQNGGRQWELHSSFLPPIYAIYLEN